MLKQELLDYVASLQITAFEIERMVEQNDYRRIHHPIRCHPIRTGIGQGATGEVVL